LQNSFLDAEDPTTAWASAAATGKIVVGEFVRAAAERHLRDLRDGYKRGLEWRPERAAHALEFLPAVFSVTAGAMAGKPFYPLSWHTFVVGSLMGWFTTADRWRFRSAWLETGKGQAKSPLMGALGIYMMGYCDIPRAEIYAIGEDKKTANVLFGDAVAMCRATIPEQDEGDSLEARGEVIIRGEGDNAWKIEHPDTSSKFQALANGEAISGPRPVAVLADEIHEFKSNYSIEVWKGAIGKMPGNAMMILGTNTPADSQIVGTTYSQFYQKVAKGEARDDSAFAFIARVDKADRENIFDNEAAWPKALPALGVTYPIENIREMVQSARTLISTASSTKRLYFGIPTGAADFWIDEEAWSAVQGDVDSQAMKGKPCYLSLDLSQKNDLTALTAAWDDMPMLRLKTWYWTAQQGMADRAKTDHAPYEDWVAEKYLTAVAGPVIEKSYVAQQVAEICSAHDVQFLAFDPAGIADFISACDAIGFAVWKYEGPGKPEGKGLKLISHAQGTKVLFEDKQLSMPRSIEKLEDRILKRTIVVDASPVTYMCAANAALDEDGQNNRAFNKKRSRGRIDGIVTVAMAVGAATMNEKPPKRSVYERRGMRWV
jgi:phage terminase large subunit-like protein